MRILSTIIEITTCSMPDVGQDLAMRNTVAAQAVGDKAPRLVLQPVQKSLEKALGCGGISAILYENIEHDPMLVHCSPEGAVAKSGSSHGASRSGGEVMEVGVQVATLRR